MKQNKPNTKRAKVLSIIASITLVLFIGGATVAWLTTSVGDDSQVYYRATTGTSDQLSFMTSSDGISFNVNYDNFNRNEGNLSDTLTATALMTANSEDFSASYYLYFYIEENTFDYTLGEDKPDLLLKVSKNGTPLTILADGTQAVTVTDSKGAIQTGFDITGIEGYTVITILENTPISALAGNTTEDEWTIEVMLVNLPGNQDAIIGSELSAKVYISGEPMEFPILLFGAMKKQFTSNTASIEAGLGIYYHDGSITRSAVGLSGTDAILDAEDLSYRYAGPSYDYTAINETYESSYNKLNKSYSSDTSGLIGMKCGKTESYPGNSCSDTKTYYIVPVGTATTYTDYNDAYEALKTLGLKALENYVCFGSNADECPANNLYRIIGAFTFDNGRKYNIKLIMNTQYTNATWDQSSDDYANGSNTWMRPASLRTALNGAYLTGLGDWSNLIYQATWKVGGDDYAKLRTGSVKTCYTNEMASLGGTYKPTTGDIDENGAYVDTKSKIGLMYISDYGYAAMPTYWKNYIDDYGNIGKNNWLFNSSYTWFITRYGNNSYEVSAITLSSCGGCKNASKSYAVYPSFYLASSVSITGGTGSASDPWRIVL